MGLHWVRRHGKSASHLLFQKRIPFSWLIKITGNTGISRQWIFLRRQPILCADWNNINPNLMGKKNSIVELLVSWKVIRLIAGNYSHHILNLKLLLCRWFKCSEAGVPKVKPQSPCKLQNLYVPQRDFLLLSYGKDKVLHCRWISLCIPNLGVFFHGKKKY